MTKKDERISASTLHQLISEYIKDQLSKITPQYPINTCNSDMYIFSRKLGNNIMIRVSDGNENKTHDQVAVLKLISNEFWRMIMGRSGEEITTSGPSHIFFKDKNVEWLTRVSGNSGDKNKTEKEREYLELVRIFISGQIEGAINLIGYRSNVKVQFQGTTTLIEVYCF